MKRTPQTITINGARYVLERWHNGGSCGWSIYRTAPRALHNCPGHFSTFSCAGRKRSAMLESAREDAQHQPGGLYYRGAS